MNRFKVSQDLRPYIVNVLERRGIKFELREIDEIIYCETELSGNKFHQVVIRAKMELEEEKNNASVSYLAEKEIGNEEVIQELDGCYTVRSQKTNQ